MRYLRRPCSSGRSFFLLYGGENPILASFLIQGSLVRHDETCLEIGFAKGSFALERVTEGQTLQSLEEIARRHFKQALQVKIVATECRKDGEIAASDYRRDGSVEAPQKRGG